MSAMGTAGAVAESGADVVARQQWLDPVADTVQHALWRAWAAVGTAGRPVKNALHGTWLGHPLHPVLTDVPIGAWTAAIVLDVAAAATGRRVLRVGAQGAILVGLAGAVGAAVSGLTDWQHTDATPRRRGLAHALANTTAAALFTTSVVLRRRHTGAGRGVAALGYVIASAAAYLGGTLVYRDRIGVDHADRNTLPREFVRVLREADLAEGRLRRAEVGAARILLVRRGTRVYALGEVCAHLGGPLAEGRLEDDTVICPWHGSRFALGDGQVIDGPSAYAQPCLETRVRDGWIEVRATGE